MADWHGDFNEEEMWSYDGEEEDSSPIPRKPRDYSSSSSSAWRLPSAPRRIPIVSNGSSSSAKHETKIVEQLSAPLNIPDWSKIYGKHGNMDSSSRKATWVDDGDDDNVVYDEEDDDMVPPHEWLAKKLARSQISSFSVCEGIGRTLKGRDLSKVRNAVLTRTGFLE